MGAQDDLLALSHPRHLREGAKVSRCAHHGPLVTRVVDSRSPVDIHTFCQICEQVVEQCWASVFGDLHADHPGRKREHNTNSSRQSVLREGERGGTIN